MPYKPRKTKTGWAVAAKGRLLPGRSKSKRMAQRRIRAIGMRTHGK